MSSIHDEEKLTTRELLIRLDERVLAIQEQLRTSPTVHEFNWLKSRVSTLEGYIKFIGGTAGALVIKALWDFFTQGGQ